MAVNRVSKKRVGVNNATTTTMRATNGTFAKVYKGNYKSSSEARSSKATANRFGTRKEKYRDLRAAFGLAAG